MNLSVANVVLLILGIIDIVFGSCLYPSYNNKTHPPAQERLKKIIGQRYSVTVGSYTYNIGVCTSALGNELPDKKFRDYGVTQSRKVKDTTTVVSVGKITNAQIIAGVDWVLLEYKEGDNYNTHCNNERRKATIMFICNKEAKNALVRVLEENTNKTKECYYLFEIGHYSICDTSTIVAKLSVGSIIVMITCITVAFYIIVGFIIQRIRGAKGMDQLPNYSQWQEFGNLIADGCDLVFRSRPKVTNHLYPPTNSRSPRQTLQPDDRHLIDDEDHDDHMLPM